MHVEHIHEHADLESLTLQPWIADWLTGNDMAIGRDSTPCASPGIGHADREELHTESSASRTSGPQRSRRSTMAALGAMPMNASLGNHGWG